MSIIDDKITQAIADSYKIMKQSENLKESHSYSYEQLDANYEEYDGDIVDLPADAVVYLDIEDGPSSAEIWYRNGNTYFNTSGEAQNAGAGVITGLTVSKENLADFIAMSYTDDYDADDDDDDDNY